MRRYLVISNLGILNISEIEETADLGLLYYRLLSHFAMLKYTLHFDKETIE